MKYWYSWFFFFSTWVNQYFLYRVKVGPYKWKTDISTIISSNKISFLLKISIIVLLSPFNVSFFSFFKLPLINLKPLYSHFRQENNDLPPFLGNYQKHQHNYDFKIDINRISGWLEMCKNIISALILFIT